MKKIVFLFIGLFLFNSAFAQTSPPSVTNVHAQQRPGTKLVDITYDLSDADGDTVPIPVRVSSDRGKTFHVSPFRVTCNYVCE